MTSNTSTDIDKLITFGQMALEQGWYDKAREYFQQALDLAPSNREAMKGLARVNEILSRRMPTPVEPTQAEIRPEPPSAKRISSRLSSVREWIRKERKEYADRVAERKRLEAEKREEQARVIEEVKQAWAEERARRGGVPLQLGQCPECGRIDSYRKKDDPSGCILGGILGVVVLGGVLMVLTMGSSEVCVGSGILIFLLLLVNLLLPSNFHCRFCGAVWRA